jgi:N-acetylglucosamine-6-phosphate deacetylase
MIQVAGIPVAEAVKMITATPARILSVDNHKGSLAPGKDADIVIFDDEISITTTISKGKTIFDKQNHSSGNQPDKHERSANIV